METFEAHTNIKQKNRTPQTRDKQFFGFLIKVTLEKEEKPGGVLKPAKAAKAWKSIMAPVEDAS